MPALPWTATTTDEAPQEVLVMGSVLRLDAARRIPGFFRAAMAIRAQVLGAEGALGVALNTHLPRKTFYTLSAWRDRDALNAFVGSQPHVSTMRRYRPAMAESKFVFWNTARDQLPASWPEVKQRLSEAPPKP